MEAGAPTRPEAAVDLVSRLPKRLRLLREIAGHTYGRLTAIAPRGSSPSGAERWLFRCDCGSHVVRTLSALRHKPDAYCGFLRPFHDGNSFARRTFGSLTALDPCPGQVSACAPQWRFRCRCGTIIEASLSHVVTLGQRSCGCGKKLPREPWLNKIVGRLTLLGPNLHITTGPEQWWCQCSCGKRVSRQLSRLMLGGVKSCGCLRTSERQERDPEASRGQPFRLGRPPKDYTGQVHGRLTAVAPDYTTAVGKPLCWWFDCSCGKRVSKRMSGVIVGTTRSCGCLRRELARARLEKARQAATRERARKAARQDRAAAPR